MDCGRWSASALERSGVLHIPGRYAECAARAPTASEAVFRRDLARTFPGDELFAEPFDATPRSSCVERSGQYALRDVLHAFVVHLESERAGALELAPPAAAPSSAREAASAAESSVTYVQGMNFVAGHMVRSGATREQAFWLMVRLWSEAPAARMCEPASPRQQGGQESGERADAPHLLSHPLPMDRERTPPYGLRAVYSEGLPKLVGTMYIVERLLERVHAPLHGLLMREEVRACVYIPQWVLPLFCHRLPRRALTLVWDEFFRDGWIAVLRTCLALLLLSAPTLLRNGGLSFERCTLHLTATLWDDLHKLEARGELRRAMDVARATVDDAIDFDPEELRAMDAAAQIEAAAALEGRRLGSRRLPSLKELRGSMRTYMDETGVPRDRVAADAAHLEVLLGQLALASANRRHHRRAAPRASGEEELCRGDCAVA